MSYQPRWVKIEDGGHPENDRQVMVWGDRLVVGLDFPVVAFLCGHCGKYIPVMAILTGSDGGDEFYSSYLQGAIGEVTHWLDDGDGPEDD